MSLLAKIQALEGPFLSRGKRALCVWVLWFLMPQAACLEVDCEQPPETMGRADIRVLSYNVGNGSSERPYALRMRDQAYEDHVGAKIRALSADIVLLQEVLPPTLCESFEERDRGRTCFDWRQREPAAKRLLGSEYTVVCDANKHVECIGIKTSFGTVRRVEAGSFSLAGAETAKLPGPSCDAIADKCSGRRDNCDEESSISSIVVDTLRGPLRIVHAHPTAIGEVCLQNQVKQAFAFADELPTILGGDWNFDPTRGTDLVPSSIWHGQVGVDQRFENHDRYTKQCRLPRTSASQKASLDRITTDFAEGRCEVLDEPRLDDGFDFERLDGKRIDHFAVKCDLSFKEP